LQRFRRVEAALLLDDVTLIQTAKLNDVDPRAWLGDVLARLPDHPARRIEELLPWQWCGSRRLAA
jgi:transposase